MPSLRRGMPRLYIRPGGEGGSKAGLIYATAAAPPCPPNSFFTSAAGLAALNK